MKEMSFGDYSSYGALIKLFKGINYDLMLTASTYLRCGLDACLAAKKLFIHRNTFNYRLNAFIAATGLDIRDYHNALFLELYFQLSAGRGLA
jgi:DNA-binding PucR family transcriptional regulator